MAEERPAFLDDNNFNRTPHIFERFNDLRDHETPESAPRLMLRRRSSDTHHKVNCIPHRRSTIFSQSISPQSRPSFKRYSINSPILSSVLQSANESQYGKHSSSSQQSNPAVQKGYLPSPNTTKESKHLQVGKYSLHLGPAIGKGGFSTVYSVSDSVDTKKKYALKIVDTSSNIKDELKINLLKEVKILESLLQVDHVIQLLAHNATYATDEIHILMELGQGDMREILSSCIDNTKPLQIDFVRYWGGQVLKAVAAIHKHNIVHADLKPANFVVVNGSLKLCDFGIANPVPEHTSTIRRDNAIGTLLYMAPETLRQNNMVYKVTKASDIWSCGIILYEMVYQEYPFGYRNYLYKAENAELEEVEHSKTTPGNSPVPLALHEVIRDCLKLLPEERTTANQAMESVFFSPVSVDLQAVQSMTRSVCKYKNHFFAQKHEITSKELDSLARALYDRLKQFNNGETK